MRNTDPTAVRTAGLEAGKDEGGGAASCTSISGAGADGAKKDGESVVSGGDEVNDNASSSKNGNVVLVSPLITVAENGVVYIFILHTSAWSSSPNLTDMVLRSGTKWVLIRRSACCAYSLNITPRAFHPSTDRL